MKKFIHGKKFLVLATVSYALCAFSGTAFAQEETISQAEQYHQEITEKDGYIQQIYATHAETLNNIFIDVTEDLLPEEKKEETEKPVETAVESVTTESNKYIINFSQSEIDLLAKVVYAESNGQPFEGQVAVAATVINRIYSPKFPNTLTQVVYAPNQFSVVRNGAINRTPNATAFQAVEAAMRGQDPSNGALYFWNPKTASNSRYFNSLTKTAQIGSHAFAK